MKEIIQINLVIFVILISDTFRFWYIKSYKMFILITNHKNDETPPNWPSVDCVKQYIEFAWLLPIAVANPSIKSAMDRFRYKQLIKWSYGVLGLLHSWYDVYKMMLKEETTDIDPIHWCNIFVTDIVQIWGS